VNYRIELTAVARRGLAALSAEDRKRIDDGILALAIDPRPPGVKKLSGKKLYRVRVGSYRVIYQIHDDRLLVLVIKIGHRREVYRNL